MDIITPARTHVPSAAAIFRSCFQLFATKPNERPKTLPYYYYYYYYYYYEADGSVWL
jgi:hypothetical protein